MKIVFLISALILIGTLSYGQVFLYKKVSISFNTAWKTFKYALSCKDSQKIHQLSLKIIDCDLFLDSDPTKPTESPFITINTFIKQLWARIPDSKLWNAVNKGAYRCEKLQDLSIRMLNI